MSGTDPTWPGFDEAIAGPAPETRRARRSDTRQRHERPAGRRGGFGGFVLGFVGVVGELLITCGVLLLAFLGWQLWWTDVEGNREQAAVVEAGGWNDPIEQATGIVTPRYDDPPVMEQPEYLTTFASMRVPRWDGEPTRTITQGTDRPNVLNPLGVGHYDGAAMPGGLGNFALAAHRTTYGKPFNRIAELQPGDPIVVWTQDTWYVYRVTGSDIVMPQDVWTIAPDPEDPSVTNETATRRLITLTSCHPMFSARERYIVWGEFEYWAPTSEGIPAELEGVEL
ncbi:class E sortase [Cellulomonas denverensis]|uniref:Class E sortase n=1 Tax=Cellulomonas denverensis TaxID=264297 RepID=A0A7X6R0I5_9CELL|nr:class E sortase [Cellulomonas denverensis]NKY24278.1 class E sortase [Cellulomonas denverensis]GIG26755.1 class E sortase [Cellulomonas denverensis]